MTSDLPRRVFEHRQASTVEITKQYGCTLLVWCENYERMDEAIAREKQIKAGRRKAKLRLIETMNRDWRDLYSELA